MKANRRDVCRDLRLIDFKNRFDLDHHAQWKRGQSHGTPRSDAVIGSKDSSE
jgi:hypothetical protein